VKRRSPLGGSVVLIMTLAIGVGAFLTFGDASAMRRPFFGNSPQMWQHPQWALQTPTDTPTPVQAPATQSQSSASSPSSSTQRTVTLMNTTQQTVWAVSTGNPGYTAPDEGEWALAPGQTVTLTYPSTWNGRIWGRTGCSFDSEGNGTCETGDCGSGITCPDLAGNIPASLAEFNLQGTGTDYYDVSLVDGFNLPLTITVVSGQMGAPANASCLTAACATNMNSASICPAILQVKDAGGTIVGCTSACNALHEDQYCCANAYASAATCNPNSWPVNYAAIFKQAVPYAYSYPFDDGTSVFTCINNCRYQIIFGG
jgi:hypothetical protein